MVLRKVMGRYIPTAITDSPKQGFSAPDSSWFREESRGFIEDKLLNRDSPIFEYLDISSVKAIVNDHISGRENRRLLIWSLLTITQVLG